MLMVSFWPLSKQVLRATIPENGLIQSEQSLKTMFLFQFICFNKILQILILRRCTKILNSSKFSPELLVLDDTAHQEDDTSTRTPHASIGYKWTLEVNGHF
jgi:hypothetical protein